MFDAIFVSYALSMPSVTLGFVPPCLSTLRQATDEVWAENIAVAPQLNIHLVEKSYLHPSPPPCSRFFSILLTSFAWKSLGEH